MAVIILSFQCKSSRKLFFVQLCGNAIYMVHFTLLGAYSGGGALLVSCLRNLVYASGRPWAAWKGWPWVMVSCNLLLTALTWKDWFSLFPLAVGVALAAEKKQSAGETGDGNALSPNYLRLSQAERERAEKMQKNK